MEVGNEGKMSKHLNWIEGKFKQIEREGNGRERRIGGGGFEISTDLLLLLPVSER